MKMIFYDYEREYYLRMSIKQNRKFKTSYVLDFIEISKDIKEAAFFSILLDKMDKFGYYLK